MRVTKTLFAALFFLLLASQQAWAQNLPAAPGDPCQTAVNFSAWINCRVDVIASARINQRGARKQVETPSIAESSTSLVDQTEAPDLLGAALNFAGVSSKDDESGDSSTSITTSAYALYAAATERDPLDPAVYQKYAGLRRLSFTVGRDKPDKEGDERALIAGFKYLIVNKRDASNPTNRDELQKVSQRLRDATPNLLDVASDVQDFLYNQLGPSLGYPASASESVVDAKIRFINERLSDATQTQATVGMLTLKQHDAINAIISAKIGTIVSLKDTSLEAFEKIRRRSQLSFSFQTKQRRRDGDDEYRAGLLYDVGVYQRLNFAANATFDYKSSKTVGGDERGGRLAVESYFHLNRQRDIFSGKDPVTLSFQGEGKWMTGAKPTYVGQAKLTIPIFDGVTLPVSFSVANRTDLIEETEVRGRFGFTFDVAKLLKGFGK